jgi:hypothetical protein
MLKQKRCEVKQRNITKNKSVKNNIKNSGVSLLILVITIIVIAIFATVVVLKIKDNSLINSAKSSVLKNDMSVMLEKYSLTYGSKLKEVNGDLSKITNSDLEGVIPDNYKDSFKATTGGIVYIGNDEKIIEIAKQLDIEVSANTDGSVAYTSSFKVNSTTDRININVSNFKKDSNIKYKFKISQFSSSLNSEEILSVTNYTKTGLKPNTMYKVEVFEINENGNVTKLSGQDVVTTASIQNPSFSEVSNDFTQGSINLVINYPEQEGLKNEFSYTGKNTEFFEYTGDNGVLEITKNGSIYARKIDASLNKSEVKEIKITSIDNEVPLLFVPSVSCDMNNLNITVTGSTTDSPATLTNASSGIKSYGFSIDNGQTFVMSDSENSHRFENLEKDKEYIVKMKVVDNAGNQLITDPINVVIQNFSKPTILLSNTSPTNEDITATIQYFENQGDTKQYSLDGTNWLNYNTPIQISKNNTIIYARILNSSGIYVNSTSIEVQNIDKLAPSDILLTPNEISSSKKVSVEVLAKDAKAIEGVTGSSGIDEIKYIWNNSPDTIDKTSPLWDSALVIQNGGSLTKEDVTGDYYLHLQVKDKAGNVALKISQAYVLNNTSPDMPVMQPLEEKLINSYTNKKEITWDVIANDGKIYIATDKIIKTGEGVSTGTPIISGNGTKKVSITLPEISGKGNLGIRLGEGNKVVNDALNETILDLTGDIVVVDTVLPSITTLEMTSSNINPLYAKNGDTITLNMTFSEDIIKDPVVTIGGRIATVTGSSNTKVAKYTIPNDEKNLTQVVLGLSITGYADAASNIGISLTNPTTSGINVVYDKTAPIAGNMVMKKGSSVGDNYTQNTWTNQSVYLEKIDGSDMQSGHSSTTYTVSGANNISETSLPVILENSGISTVTLTTKDLAGNLSIRSYIVKIDKSAPVPGELLMKLENSSGAEYINNTVTDKSVYLELINGSDELSGIESTSYMVSGANNISLTTAPNILSNEGVSTATVITKDLSRKYINKIIYYTNIIRKN